MDEPNSKSSQKRIKLCIVFREEIHTIEWERMRQIENNYVRQ